MNIDLKIDPVVCVQCGVCVDTCPTDVISPREGQAPTVKYLDDCQACFLCVFDCPVEAISLRQDRPTLSSLTSDPVLSGEVYGHH